ncbi:hypothetical protein TruAng_004346 [Truncatella angustata]|nr:hypothetical protein TruAng_004346 [Truncatella angustata]
MRRLDPDANAMQVIPAQFLVAVRVQGAKEQAVGGCTGWMALCSVLGRGLGAALLHSAPTSSRARGLSGLAVATIERPSHSLRGVTANKFPGALEVGDDIMVIREKVAIPWDS